MFFVFPFQESSLDGKPCSGIKFTADANDCSKYYLCNNEIYVELRCPEPLHWNKVKKESLTNRKSRIPSLMRENNVPIVLRTIATGHLNRTAEARLSCD